MMTMTEYNNVNNTTTTASHVNKKNGRLKLYLNISDDPNLKNVPPESLFSTD